MALGRVVQGDKDDDDDHHHHYHLDSPIVSPVKHPTNNNNIIIINNRPTTTRRHWVLGLSALAAGSSWLWPSVSEAYEERPVGGDNRSAATAAMNRQAIETNNRLEREGVKLETQAEQIASLSAQLSSYSYEPTTGSGSSSSTKTTKPTTTTTTSPKTYK
ncbi:hypothetical protein ACA910_001289 [Epithemia clementina (nom. ined.)]